ncbi:MAG: electron transport complex subunit RsxE [Clostridia bacterium]|nr:electron transport complex subunit RsxE [Clostridia bacterium]
MNKYVKQIKDSIVDQNPVLVQFLGMCPTLATTTSVSNAIGMGLAATAVLICSNVFISLLRKFIPKEIRIASYIVIISGFVTAVELLMKAFFTPLYDALGLYIPLIVVNCIILARAEAYASKNPVLPSAVDGLAMGLGFTAALILIASVREILGAGTWLGLRVTPAAFQPALIFILPAGAFLTLGLVSAAVNKGKDLAAAYADAHPKPEGVAVLPDEIVTEAPAAAAIESVAEAETPSEETHAPKTESAPTQQTDTVPTEDAVSAEPITPTAESAEESVKEETTNKESEETTNGTAD